MKPRVFKAAGAWVAHCPDHIVAPWQQLHHPGSWRDPWQAAVQNAIVHAAQFHTEGTRVR